MPIYCYKCQKCGKVEEKIMSASEASFDPILCSCFGTMMRDLREEHAPREGKVDPWREHYSDALAVDPSKIKETIEDAKKRGVSIDFAPDGRAKFNSAAQKLAYMKAYGFRYKQ